MIDVMLGRITLAFVLCLAAGSARAEAEAPNPAKPAAGPKKKLGRVPFRVVKLLPETGQALVYDHDRRAHVLVTEGDTVGGFSVVEVDDDHLVVSREGRELVLVADPRAPQPPTAIAPDTVDPYGTMPAPPLDPYAPLPRPAPTKPGLAPIDPYAPPTPREVLAPAGQRESLRGVAVVDPYAPPRTGEPMTVTAPDKAQPLKATPAPGSPSAPEAIRADVMTVKRSELEGALGDFSRLGKDIGFTRLPRGVKLGTVATTSYFWKLGLRGGDIVTAIDGKPLRSLDDAAAAYVKLGSAQKLAVEVERGNARGTLRFALK
jgi:membrane-associated protease RseP (regulator of RpoE activity)